MPLLAGLLLVTVLAAPALAIGISLGPTDRLLVIAPHPDDETLGAAGLIQAVVEEHLPVQVVVVTNGDGSTPAAERLAGGLLITTADRLKLGVARQGETLAALAALGVTRESVQFLGYPDKLLSFLWEDYWRTPYHSTALGTDRVAYQNVHTPHAPFAGASLRDDLSAIIKAFQPTVMVIPSALDTHSDHRAAALFAQQAVFENPSLHPRLYAYLVHRGPWPPTGQYLQVPESALAAQLDWFNVALKPNWVTRKAEAIRLYKTQIAISEAYLLSFVKPNELFSAVRQVHLGGVETFVSRESEARAGMRDVAVTGERLLKVKDPGVWTALARVEGENLHLRLAAELPKLAPREYTFLVRDGERFIKVATNQPATTVALKGEKFFLTVQIADAKGHVLVLPWVAAVRPASPAVPPATPSPTEPKSGMGR